MAVTEPKVRVKITESIGGAFGLQGQIESYAAGKVYEVDLWTAYSIMDAGCGELIDPQPQPQQPVATQPQHKRRGRKPYSVTEGKPVV